MCAWIVPLRSLSPQYASNGRQWRITRSLNQRVRTVLDSRCGALRTLLKSSRYLAREAKKKVGGKVREFRGNGVVSFYYGYVYHVTIAGSLGGQLKCDNRSINQSINQSVSDRTYRPR